MCVIVDLKEENKKHLRGKKYLKNMVRIRIVEYGQRKTAFSLRVVLGFLQQYTYLITGLGRMRYLFLNRIYSIIY